MVQILSVLATVLALTCSAEACAGWYQCKFSDGSHCCVVDSGAGPGSCPSRCNGGTAWPPECISQTTGNSRHPCDGR